MRQGNIDEIEDVSQWVRGIFKRSWLKHDVYHLIWDFSGGLIIIYLAEALTCRKLPLLHSKPKDFAEKIGNIELALQAFKDDGVEFPGIFAHDIANGDEEIIIMLCYILKHHYSADQPARGWTIDVEQASHLGPLFLFDDASKASVDNRLDFEPFEKEDISLFDWVSHQIGKEILDYQIFKDGFILCKLINIVSPRRIPEKLQRRFYPVQTHQHCFTEKNSRKGYCKRFGSRENQACIGLRFSRTENSDRIATERCVAREEKTNVS
ncbi:uncharacterized protein LOC135695217 isoform X3 [Rhopilema esculentum]|uniref:uncharacterized protein LOC135695217 isoform X3 n=1 Tax=Rhopilema esculentum TaxID=499914 RepID=UPI0031D59B2B